MNNFSKLINEALWQHDLTKLEEARQVHDQLVVQENVKYSEIVDEIDRVKREDQPDYNEFARIYLDSLNYDLTAIKRDQARRLDTLERHNKTIQLYKSWETKEAA